MTARKPKKPKSGWHGDPARHAECGRQGGLKSAQDKTRMAEIGRLGGLARARKRREQQTAQSEPDTP